MNLEKILSISGKPGLFELKSQTRSGFLAQSLLDGKRISVGLRHNVSMLSEIAIYTYGNEIPLQDIFKTIATKEGGNLTSVSHKAGKNELQNYFSEIVPNYDEERVYPSDMKKVIQWYNMLNEKQLLSFETTSSEEE
jgi:hypothetical protein